MSALASAIIARAANSNAATRESVDLEAGQPRHEIYRCVHKGLRACMSETLVILGRVDLDSPLDVAGALNAISELLDLCAEHVAHENGFLHTALDRAQPGSATTTAAEHAHHLTAIAMLDQRVSAARHAAGPDLAREMQMLYRLVALFVADNFQHMEIEESANTEMLWRYYSDAELREIEQAIHAHVKPERMLIWLRWILPNLTRQERAGVLMGMRAGLPEAGFVKVLDMVRQHLSPTERAALAADLG